MRDSWELLIESVIPVKVKIESKKMSDEQKVCPFQSGMEKKNHVQDIWLS
jgi:hypothetical protein